MEYRNLEKLNIKTSLLGFGCMRFPILESGEIDEKQATSMIDYAISKGVNYIDTAYPYHNGKSELFVGKVLKKYKREKFYLATKMPIWNIESLEDAQKIFQEQLERLQVEYVDFYLLHALDRKKWKKVLDLDILSFVQQLKKEGKIKYIGFSFHDDYDVFETIINSFDWDFCQIQLNYIDTDIQAGMKGYQLTQDKGIPLIIMEPIKGGYLSNLPEDIANMFFNYNPHQTLSSWALRFVGSLSNVKVILSGMSTLEQVVDNIKTFDKFQPLSVEENQLVHKVAQTIKSRTKNGCTGCSYCMPCPFGIDIPKNFRIWNDLSMYGQKDLALTKYLHLEPTQRASFCKQCGKCETMCPQAIAIRDDLKQVVKDLLEY